MKSLTSYIKEAKFDYTLHYFNGQNHTTTFTSAEEARKFIKSKNKVEYYDICKGDNTSEESNLIEWYGKGGYWYNFCYEPVYAQDHREKAVAERAKKKEIKK